MRRVVCWVSGMHFSDASRLGTDTKEELTVDVAVEMPSDMFRSKERVVTSRCLDARNLNTCKRCLTLP